MSRYKNTKLTQKNGTSYYKKTLYKEIPESDNDIYVITQSGDRLDLLAYQYYGDVSLWWYIAKANNLNKMNIEDNTQIRIPGSTKYAEGK